MKRGEKKYLKYKGSEMPHIGSMLTAYINEHRIYQAALARALQRHSNTLFLYKKSQSVQAAILWELCHALKHNFFADMAMVLPDAFTGALATLKAEHAEAMKQKDDEIEKLQQENLLLRELLRDRR